MTAKDLFQVLGQEREYTVNGMIFKVTVVDAKIAYGKVRYQIQPVAGQCSAWVDAESVR